jgi:hypothetical protein
MQSQYLLIRAIIALAWEEFTRALKHDDVDIPAEHVHAAFLAALKTYGQVLTMKETLSTLA